MFTLILTKSGGNDATLLRFNDETQGDNLQTQYDKCSENVTVTLE